MESLNDIHPIAVVIGLLIILAVIATLARRLGVPYPLLMLVTGLLIGFIPGLPHITLTPELVAKLVAGVNDELAGVDPAELVARRDAVLNALLAAKTRADLP